ncbi:MAG: enoyl-CoA hydratase-related protein, partial [Candidatus Rokuibacteriota bacterium]
MKTEFVRTEIRDHIATVTLDRPPVNAMNRQLFEEIRDTFATVATDWEVRAVVFASACARVFSAGADLKGRGEPPPGPPPT